MNLDCLIPIFIGSLIGVSLRLFIITNLKRNVFSTINNIAIINIISSLIVGILIGINIKYGSLYLLLMIGFLGCFSSFSSFIYQLFNYLQQRKYIKFIKHYIEVISFSIVFFTFGLLATDLLLR